MAAGILAGAGHDELLAGAGARDVTEVTLAGHAFALAGAEARAALAQGVAVRVRQERGCIRCGGENGFVHAKDERELQLRIAGAVNRADQHLVESGSNDANGQVCEAGFELDEAEIDERIAAEIDNRVTAEVDSRILMQLDRYAGCRHQRRRAKRVTRAERRASRAERTDRAGRQSIMLALGSMLVALLVTAIVLKGSPGVAAIMLMGMIWIIVGIINVAYAMVKHPQK